MTKPQWTPMHCRYAVMPGSVPQIHDVKLEIDGKKVMNLAKWLVKVRVIGDGGEVDIRSWSMVQLYEAAGMAMKDKEESELIMLVRPIDHEKFEIYSRRRTGITMLGEAVGED